MKNLILGLVEGGKNSPSKLSKFEQWFNSIPSWVWNLVITVAVGLACGIVSASIFKYFKEKRLNNTVAGPFCKNCGRPIDSDAKFCSSCGTEQ